MGGKYSIGVFGKNLIGVDNDSTTEEAFTSNIEH